MREGWFVEVVDKVASSAFVVSDERKVGEMILGSEQFGGKQVSGGAGEGM
jgi:hypothetical protein